MARSNRPTLIAAAVAVASSITAVAAPDPSARAHWVRVETGAQQLERVRGTSAGSSDYGRFQWLAVDDAQLQRLHAAGLDVDEIAEPFVLDLGGVRFDPAQASPSLPADWRDGARADADGSDLHLLQFGGPVRQVELDALRVAGVEPVQYIHPFTYVVWARPSQMQAARSRAAVRWSGDFAPAYRVLPQWRALSADLIDVHVSTYRGAGDVAVRLRAAGAGVVGERAVDRGFSIVDARVRGDRLGTLARVAGVYSIQPVPRDGGMRGEMSDQIVAGNYGGNNLAVPGYLAWLAQTGVNGNGVIIADVDGGIYDTHPDLVHRMLPCTGTTCGGSATDAHGTHTAGIMAADGSSGTLANGFLRGLGMAPGAKLVEQLYDPTFTQAGGMLLLMTESQRNGAVMSGNSWGPAGSPRGYDDDTRQVDVGVRDADPAAAGDQPFHFVLSIMNGNGGVSSQGTPDEAKNIFTIGSTKMQSSPTVQITEIDDISSNSAHGPALDGRSIPAMVAPGCSVDSSASSTGYQLMCGTSMASPHVTGASALFVEYYRNLFGRDPSPAMIKAAFTAVAKNLTGNRDADGVVLTRLFDNKQGWGRLQLPPVLVPTEAVEYVDQTTVLDNTGESWTHTYTAADPAKPIRIMLTWTDAPGHGLGGSTPAWNNDLDLRVTANGNVYRGNVLDNAGWSTGGGSADAKNNTEAVFLQAAQHAGSVTVEVLASDINSDALPHSGDATDQDFALVCYNCVGEAAASANLAVTASANASAVVAGQAIRYTIDVHNDGPDAATNVRVAIDAPDLADIAAADGQGWTCSDLHANVACTRAEPLAAGATSTLVLDATVGATPGDPVVAAFAVSADETDADSTDDIASVSTPLDDVLFADGFEPAM
ncbi:MAG: S8 family serine peptidase [Dokdonella sp.]|uniref:S8 family serine peptidase n=1 Tax=Dokdonella sp. TaxID=2291710 RepID=UPI003F81867C